MMVVALLLLAACGGGDEPTPTTVPASAAPESPLQPESPLPSSDSGADEAAAADASDVEADPEAASESNAEADTEEVAASVDESAPAQYQSDYTMNQPEFAESKADMGTVVGRLVSNTTDVPLNHEIVRLGEVECPEEVLPENKRTECVWMLSNAFSPSTFTDENGFFVFNDVDPRDYVVIVGDMMNKNTKLADENGPFMWSAVGNEITDIGEYHIEW